MFEKLHTYSKHQKKCIHSRRATYYENITIYYHKESWHDYHLKAINMTTNYNTVLDPMTLIVTHQRRRTRTLQHKASTRIEILLQKKSMRDGVTNTYEKMYEKEETYITKLLLWLWCPRLRADYQTLTINIWTSFNAWTTGHTLGHSSTNCFLKY